MARRSAVKSDLSGALSHLHIVYYLVNTESPAATSHGAVTTSKTDFVRHRKKAAGVQQCSSITESPDDDEDGIVVGKLPSVPGDEGDSGEAGSDGDDSGNDAEHDKQTKFHVKRLRYWEDKDMCVCAHCVDCSVQCIGTSYLASVVHVLDLCCDGGTPELVTWCAFVQQNSASIQRRADRAVGLTFAKLRACLQQFAATPSITSDSNNKENEKVVKSKLGRVAKKTTTVVYEDSKLEYGEHVVIDLTLAAILCSAGHLKDNATLVKWCQQEAKRLLETSQRSDRARRVSALISYANGTREFFNVCCTSNSNNVSASDTGDIEQLCENVMKLGLTAQNKDKKDVPPSKAATASCITPEAVVVEKPGNVKQRPAAKQSLLKKSISSSASNVTAVKTSPALVACQAPMKRQRSSKVGGSSRVWECTETSRDRAPLTPVKVKDNNANVPAKQVAEKKVGKGTIITNDIFDLPVSDNDDNDDAENMTTAPKKDNKKKPQQRGGGRGKKVPVDVPTTTTTAVIATATVLTTPKPAGNCTAIKTPSQKTAKKLNDALTALWDDEDRIESQLVARMVRKKQTSRTQLASKTPSASIQPSAG